MEPIPPEPLGEIEQKIFDCLKQSLLAKQISEVAEKINESLAATAQGCNGLHQKGLLDYEDNHPKVKLSPRAWGIIRQSL